jgi:hypothetical protein
MLFDVRVVSFKTKINKAHYKVMGNQAEIRETTDMHIPSSPQAAYDANFILILLGLLKSQHLHDATWDNKQQIEHSK